MAGFSPARLLALAALAAFTMVSGGWYLQSCDGNTEDVAVVAPNQDDLNAGASAASRCKRGLDNIRYRFFSGLPDGSSTLIYFGGQRTNWCWTGGSVVSRHTEFPKGWTSVVGSGSVSSYVWSSGCQTGNASCLVRAEFWARLDATVPVVGVTVGINEVYCVGTRVYAGGAHSRNITGGGCPGSTALAGATLSGLSAGALEPALRARIGRLAFSARNLEHMRDTGRPLPELARVLKQVYERLSPDERRQLRACAGLSPRSWELRGGSPCEVG